MQRPTLLPVALVLLAAVPAALRAADESDAEFARVVQPFLRQHCFACHGPDKQSGQIRHDRLSGFRAEETAQWTLIHEQIAGGEMPPADQPQPPAADQQRVLAWIEASQRRHRLGGTRRLNRRELAAALRDVTGLSVDYESSLPGDGKVNGFDTGASGLQDAADSVAAIMQVTRRAVEGLRFLAPANRHVIAVDLVQAKSARQAFDPWKASGVTTGESDTLAQPGVGAFLRPKWVGDRGGFSVRLPPPAGRLGILRLSAIVSAVKNRPGLPNPRLWVEVGGKDLDYVEITNPPERPRTLTYEVQLADVAIDAKGLEITLSNRVEVPYAIDGFPNDDRSKPADNLPGGTGLFRPLYDNKSRLPAEQPVPFVVLHRVEIDADHRAQWPPASWNAELEPLADDAASAQQLLHLWIERAWRRPVAAAEEQRFLDLYHDLRRQQLSFDEALRAAFQSVLMSGSFRYLPGPDDVPPPLAEHALASRLSFLLWGTPPDVELRRLATAGKLRQRAVLERQVDRLLADPRSSAFVRPFVSQWLELGQPITIAMDHIQKQDFRFGRYLKASLHEESLAYFAQALVENRPARELLVSDWTMMNDILARHYGYAGVEGGELRQVQLRPDDPRGGGYVGQAGIQSMLCWMGENWVIYRGAWTLRRLLDDPPPPPPLEVPELLPSDAANHGKTFKELLRQHQADDRCAVCHRKIDPLGFAFQNFDLSGRWREVEHDHYVMKDLDGKIEWNGVGKTRPVDASGALPRGEKFTSFAEFKRLLVQHYTEDFTRGLLKNLIIYGAGRQPDVADLAEIQAILAAHQQREYPLRDLVKALICSPAIQGRSAAATNGK